MDVVQKIWGFCNVLKHDGVNYGDYIEQLTYLLFLKLSEEKGLALPEGFDWPALRAKSGTDLTDHYQSTLRELGKQRWSPQGIMSPGSPGMYEAQFYKALGPKYSDYAISNVPWYNPNAALTKRVEAAFNKQFPKEKLMFHALNVGFTFESLMIAADAFKRAGSTDGTALADAIRKTNIADRMMVGGPISFDAKGQNTQIASACIQNRGGQPVVVLPSSAAQAKPVFPVPGWTQRG